jgi:TetR/AcrR family transcriptional regulator, transcriptional repressor for nem operon
MPRPREFDTDTALRAMTLLFWEHGFEGTSMHDIERGTGLRKQSLYRAFGDKRAMYLAALAAYEHQEIAEGAKLLAGPGTAAERFGRLFRHIIAAAVDDGDRRGCFLCNACIDQAPLDTRTGKLVADMMARIEDTFDTTLAETGLAAQTDAGGTSAGTRRKTTRALLTGYFGLRVLVKAGAARDTLQDAAERMLSSLCPVTA